MEAFLHEIEIYLTPNRRCPFTEWLNSLRDIRARAAIRVRLDRIRFGNFGDFKFLGEGLYELRIHTGPGYRVYYGSIDSKIVLLLCGGDKHSQERDIRKATEYWQDYLKL